MVSHHPVKFRGHGHSGSDQKEQVTLWVAVLQDNSPTVQVWWS